MRPSHHSDIILISGFSQENQVNHASHVTLHSTQYTMAERCAQQGHHFRSTSIPLRVKDRGLGMHTLARNSVHDTRHLVSIALVLRSECKFELTSARTQGANIAR